MKRECKYFNDDIFLEIPKIYAYIRCLYKYANIKIFVLLSLIELILLLGFFHWKLRHICSIPLNIYRIFCLYMEKNNGATFFLNKANNPTY